MSSTCFEPIYKKTVVYALMVWYVVHVSV